MALDFLCSLSKPQHNVKKIDTSQYKHKQCTHLSHICTVCVTYGDIYCLYSSHINISTVCMEDINNRIVTVSESNKKPSWSEQNVHPEPQKMLTMRKNKISKYRTYRRHKELTWIHSQTHWMHCCSVWISSRSLSILLRDLSTLHTLKTNGI